MKEFMLLIRNQSDSQSTFTPEQHQRFLDDCKVYIENLMKDGKLKIAQPLVREGKMISGTPGAWRDGPFSDTREVIVGYYHIFANDVDEAIAIAKMNPEFAYTKTARVEVRPIKMKEETTGFNYPEKS